MKQWKNKEHSTLPKSITVRTMSFKMHNFPVFGLLRILTSENENKCKQKLTKKHHFHAYFYVKRIVQITF